jgi:hypothetical protein
MGGVQNDYGDRSLVRIVKWGHAPRACATRALFYTSTFGFEPVNYKKDMLHLPHGNHGFEHFVLVWAGSLA